jgi:hypothetical protein
MMATMQPTYTIGLDLGQAHESTAMVVMERSPSTDPSTPAVYSLRHAQRFTLGTPYTAIVPAVAELAATVMKNGHTTLVVDQTGVGRAVFDLLLRYPVPCYSVALIITNGHYRTEEKGGDTHVPKKDLVSLLQVVLQSRRLKIAHRLPHAAVLVKELQTFRAKITVAANEIVEDWRERDHDDLVLAVALACWWAENNFCGPWKCCTDPERSLIAQLFDKIGWPEGWEPPEED